MKSDFAPSPMAAAIARAADPERHSWDGSPWHCIDCDAEVEPGELFCSDFCEERIMRQVKGDALNDQRDEEEV